MIGTLAVADIQVGHRRAMPLNEGKGLTGIDRLQLRAVADHHQTVEPQAIGDGHQIIHWLVGDQRGLVQNQHHVLQCRSRSIEGFALTGQRRP